MRSIFLLSFVFLAINSKAQDSLKQATGADTSKISRTDEDYDKTFIKVEIEPAYPGGQAAWQRFLNKNLHYPDDAINNEVQSTIIVQFIVDKQGNTNDVQAVSGPTKGGLRDEAIRIIKLSGKWLPAVQNGRQVKSYKKQPVVFKLDIR